ncbi:MAG: OpgC domain-containing protein, partial [bacterium]
MQRDHALDVLRGIMLVIMAVDHFGEPIEPYTWQFLGFVTAAEGFVFLSGMLVGIVYSRYLTQPKAILNQHIWDRARVIYRYHLLTLLGVFLFTTLSVWSGAAWESYATEMTQQPWLSLLLGISLLYLPPMLDILPIYILFMLLTPYVLRGLHSRYVYLVLLISALLWLLAQFDVQKALLFFPLPDAMRLGAFDPFGWQLIFVLGMYLGYRRFQRGGRPQTLSWSLLAIASAIVVVLFAQRHGIIHVTWLDNYVYIDRESIAWLRLLNFLAVVYVIHAVIIAQQHYRIFYVFEPLGRWLGFLGKHSLQVFAFHLVVLYCYIPFRWGEWALSDSQKLVLAIVFIASLSLPAWWHQRYQQHQRQRRQQAKAQAETNTLKAQQTR